MAFQNSKQRSWWESTAMAYPRDVIIVGAGITGLSVALFYKRACPKHSVLVLDRGFWPIGATGRNAGSASFDSASELVDDLEHESEEDVRSRLENRFEGLELLKSELGHDAIDYHMCGGYEVFDTTDEKLYELCKEKLPQFNAWVEAGTGEKETYELKTCNGFKTIFNRLEGYLHSGKMLNRLMQKATEAGVEIRLNTPVESINTGAVMLDDGLTLQADKILSAVNGFSKKLIPESSVKPARGYIFVTKPLKNMPWKGTFHYNKGYVYFRDLGDRLLIGGARDVDKVTETSYTNDINPKIKNWLIDFTTNKLKIDSDWKIEQEWTGTMGFGSTKSPECFMVKDGIWIAAGLGGMGVALGMNLGKKAAEMMGDF